MNDATTTIPNEGLSLDELQRDPFVSQSVGAYGNPEDDKKLIVRFYMFPVEQTAQSIKAGRKIFKDTEYIEILTPGDKYSIIKRQVFDMDRKRFAEAYARFKAGQQETVSGTPLSTLVWMSEARIKEYEFFNILTVEQLAEASDGAQVSSMMGFQEDKRKAQSFISSANDSAPLTEMRAKLDERDAQLEMLQKQVQEMNARMEKQSRPGPGRPPKE